MILESAISLSTTPTSQHSHYLFVPSSQLNHAYPSTSFTFQFPTHPIFLAETSHAPNPSPPPPKKNPTLKQRHPMPPNTPHPYPKIPRCQEKTKRPLPAFSLGCETAGLKLNVYLIKSYQIGQSYVQKKIPATKAQTLSETISQ